jgi:glucokinase
MFLGIEIGGTKLQLGVGAGDGSDFLEFRRLDVEIGGGAAAILDNIDRAAGELIAKHSVTRIGFGFGGPVDAARGRVVKSHQVTGWEDFPLVDWCQARWPLPVALGNDCDVAGLAEARFGAGSGCRVVFYVTIGTGVGGGLTIDGRIFRGSGSIAAEIGHLRPSLDADTPQDTVEAQAAGPAILEKALELAQGMDHRGQPAMAGAPPPNWRNAKDVSDAARLGDWRALHTLARAHRAMGWAIAQVVTLVAPEVIVLGGGVSLIGEAHWLAPIRWYAEKFAFPPLAGSYQIVPARLGEEVVVHGALALAATKEGSG